MVIRGWQFGGSLRWWSCEMSMVGLFVHVTSYGRVSMGLFFNFNVGSLALYLKKN